MLEILVRHVQAHPGTHNYLLSPTDTNGCVTKSGSSSRVQISNRRVSSTSHSGSLGKRGFKKGDKAAPEKGEW